MDREFLDRVKAIFDAARRLPPSAWASHLESASRDLPDGPRVRAEVESLLRSLDNAGEFLASPTVPDVAPGIETLGNPGSASPSGATLIEGGSRSPAARESAVRDAPGMRIGQYTLVRLIGEGGMGAVYLARQEKPAREVALKILRGGFASQTLLRRFELEAELLGRLQHTGIAQIHEAGTYEVASVKYPYFAMEYVSGDPLNKYVERHSPGTRQRLELAARIADAVQHAHQKGIIHRDLKPGNILVTSDGQPKILDFGVARATNSDIQATTLRTDIGQLIGTIPYMSPEQVTGDSHELDTRSDVYALGVVLYELLSGRLPYSLEKKMIHEAVRVIREDEPTKLSSISRVFRGDVETIVAKALEKDRNRRYQSANALAADIRRYLSDEPIAARPPSAWYQFSKFAHRHKGLVGGVAAAFVLLVAGLIGTGHGLIRAKEALALEEKAKFAASEAQTRAERQALRSDKVAELLKETLEAAGPYVALGKDATLLREILLKSAESIPSELKDAPEVEAEVRSVIGRTLRDIGETKMAESQLEQSIALWRRLGEEVRPSLAFDLEVLGWMFVKAYNADRAEPLLNEAIEIRRATAEENAHIAASMGDLGLCAYIRGNPTKAESLLREAVAMMRRAKDRDDPASRLGDTLGSLGWVVWETGRAAEAVGIFEEALALHRARLPATHPYIAATLSNLGGALTRCNRAAEAVERITESVELNRQLVGAEHIDFATGESKLASAYEELGDFDRAESLYQDALRIFSKKYGANHVDIAMCLNNLGHMYLKSGRLAESVKPFQRTLEILQVLGTRTHPNAAATMMNLSSALSGLGRAGEGEPYAREAVDVYRRVYASDHQYVLSAMFNLATTLWVRARTIEDITDQSALFTESETLLLEVAEHIANPDSIPLAIRRDVMQALVTLYTHWEMISPGSGMADKAAECRRKLAELTPASAPSSQPATSQPTETTTSASVSPPPIP